MTHTAYVYGSNTLGESRDNDIVYIVSNDYRIHDLYTKLKKNHHDQDIVVFDPNGDPSKDAIYPHTRMPHIFSECIRHTTPAEGIWNYSHEVVEEIPLLFKGGIEVIIEGEPQKGLFKLLQFIAMQRNIKMHNHAIICDTSPDMFTKTGLCRLTGFNIYNKETKQFDTEDSVSIIEIATQLLGSPVTISINKVVYVEACIYTGGSYGTIDEGIMTLGSMDDICCEDDVSLRDILLIDENIENPFSVILKNKNVDIRPNADIKYRVFGETRWDI